MPGGTENDFAPLIALFIVSKISMESDGSVTESLRTEALSANHLDDSRFRVNKTIEMMR